MKSIKTVGIIGYGKFAQLVEKILGQNDSIKTKIYSRRSPIDNSRFFSWQQVCNCDVVIPAVPINKFSDVIAAIGEELSRSKGKEIQTVLDVCSVKVMPKREMLAKLPKKTNIICSHPNFGPESYRLNGNSTNALNFIIENVRCDKGVYEEIKKYLENVLKLNVIELDADTHDKEIGLPHFLSMIFGLTINRMQIERTSYGAASTEKMFDMAEGVGKDLAIVEDMYRFNPYCKAAFADLGKAFQSVLEDISN
jgi:prephenate dehydrogenase